MIYRVQAPDGTIYRVEGPDGASQEEVIAQAQNLLPSARETNVSQDAFETKLSSDEETKFKAWKQKYAPRDSGVDYDLRGAFKEGLTPDPTTGHWPDTYKKPNHPTFSNESKYARDEPGKAGHWEGDTYVPPDPGRAARLEALKKPLPGEETVPDTGVNVPILGKVGLPAVGGAVGAMTGSGAASIPLAAVGGALGEGADQLLQQAAGLPAAQAPGAQMATEGAIQGASQAVGMGVGNVAGKLISGVGGPAARGLLSLADQAGIPITAEKLLDSSAAKAAARLARSVPGAGHVFKRAEAKGQEGIESAAGKALSGLPSMIEKDLDFGEAVKQGVLSPAIARNKAEVNAAYQAAAAFVDPVKDRALPRNLYGEAVKIQGEFGKGSRTLASTELRRLTDEIVADLGPQAGTSGTRVWTKQPYENLDQWRRQLYDAKGSQTELYTPIQRQLARLHGAVTKDIASIPNPALQAATQAAADLHKAKVVPFLEGETGLNRLVNSSAQQVASALDGKGGAQIIRDLKPHLHPDELDTLTGQAVGKIFQGARDPKTEALIGSKVLDGARRQWPALAELRDKQYADDLVDLGRVMDAAQRGVKKIGGEQSWIMSHPALAGLGFGAGVTGLAHEGGAVLLHHPLAMASVAVPAATVAGLMATKPGVRFLLTGFSGGRISPELGAALGKGAGVALGAKIGQGVDSANWFSKEIEKQVPDAMHQIQVQQKGPNGELPVATIGGPKSALDPLMATAALEHQLSPQLVKAVATAESSMNPQATSPKGAQGVMQLMPGTARAMGVNDPRDPVENVRGGTKYLSQLMQQYQGNKELALAAYNAGPEAVAKYGGVPPYPETQKYVRDVLAREQQYMSDREGLSKPTKRDMSWTEISDLYQRARRTDDQGAWKTLRGAINRRINVTRDKPMFGMSAQEYRKLYPAILKATRPEQEPVVTTALSG